MAELEIFQHKWENTQFESATGDTPQFKQFYREFKMAITKELKANHIEILKWNKGHFECSLFVRRNDNKIFYIAVLDLRLMHSGKSPLKEILYREADDIRDYRGKHNNFCELRSLSYRIRNF